MPTIKKKNRNPKATNVSLVYKEMGMERVAKIANWVAWELLLLYKYYWSESIDLTMYGVIKNIVDLKQF